MFQKLLMIDVIGNFHTFPFTECTMFIRFLGISGNFPRSICGRGSTTLLLDPSIASQGSVYMTTSWILWVRGGGLVSYPTSHEREAGYEI